VLNSLEGGIYEVSRFLRGIFSVIGDPRTLFSDVCDLKQIWVKSGFAQTAPEGLTVVVRRTRRDHNPIEIVFANGLLDLLLALE
jgi:hypothetical protein